MRSPFRNGKSTQSTRGSFFGAVQKLRLDARGSHVIDDEQSIGYEARDYFLVGLGVELRGLNIREAKRDFLEAGDVFESVAMNGADRTYCSGAGHVFSDQGEFLFIGLDHAVDVLLVSLHVLKFGRELDPHQSPR